MKQPIMKKWVAALRSGEYEQITGGLSSDVAGTNLTGFCCLGVLTDLCAKDSDLPLEALLSIKQDGGLCLDVEKWAGMGTDMGFLPKMVPVEPEYEDSLTHDDLANLNDSGADFNRIADVIEEHWEKL